MNDDPLDPLAPLRTLPVPRLSTGFERRLRRRLAAGRARPSRAARLALDLWWAVTALVAIWILGRLDLARTAEVSLPAVLLVALVTLLALRLAPRPRLAA